jgi:hypothetical protein
MADLYSLVKKQDEKIDDLLKTAKENKDLLTDIDTRLASEPVQTEPSASAIPEKIQVELPANIATNESVKRLVEAALAQQKVDALKSLDFSQLPKDLAEAFVMFFKNGLDESVKKALHAGIHTEFATQTSDLRDAARQLNNRMHNVIDGAVWAAIPKWVYAVVGFILLAAVGLGIGCYHLYEDNESLRQTEWLYRYERLWWEGKHQEDLLRREKTFAVGTQQEQDSIKNITRQLEKSRHIEETFLYFNPTEK